MKHIFLPILAVSVSLLHAAPLELGSPFTEHMVLQRDTKVPVWGWAKPGVKVEIKIAGQTATSTAGKDGAWKTTLSPLKTGGPYTFSVTSGKESIRFTDVLAGEVWIASGQSNMSFGSKRMIGVEKMLNEAKGRPLRSFNVDKDVSLAPKSRCQGIWRVQPSSSAVAFAFSLFLQNGLGPEVPVGIIQASWGSSSLEGWMPLDMTSQFPHFKKAMKAFEKNDKEKVLKLIADRAAGKKWPNKENIYLRTRPNILYNAMLHPLVPYASRGMIWYQGEANTKSIDAMLRYGATLKAWTQRLRKEWGRDDFYMDVVMLPRFARTPDRKAPDDPTAHSWAWMRAAQLEILDLPHSGVAVTVDLGDPKNIHPHDKAPVGKRLALLALHDIYGKPVVARGPMLERAEPRGSSLRVSFKHAEGLQTTDGKPPRSFWLADENGQWHPATTAKIDGNAVMLSTPKVPRPKFVRYAWTAVPDVNLVNSANLPAAPFRTDSFEP